jgi:hypothetical protein
MVEISPLRTLVSVCVGQFPSHLAKRQSRSRVKNENRIRVGDFGCFEQESEYAHSWTAQAARQEEGRTLCEKGGKGRV